MRFGILWDSVGGSWRDALGCGDCSATVIGSLNRRTVNELMMIV